MKIKADFVTNSSSSSFIVFWPYIVNEESDVSKFIKRKSFVKTIYGDIKKGQKGPLLIQMTKEVIQTVIDEISQGYVEDVDIDYWDHRKEFCMKNGITIEELRNNHQWIHQCYEEMDIIKKERCTKKAIKLIEKYENTYAYFFEYSDEDGEYFSQLEHENDWGGLPYFRINKH